MEKILSRENKKLVWIAAALMVALSMCTCGGLLGLFAITGGIFSGLSKMEKTYYPECEKTAGDVCKTCCETRGHSGYAAGELMNEPGKVCGCL